MLEEENKDSTESVTMKDGKMMKVKNGEMINMDEDIILSNETKIMIDGTILKIDGYKMRVKEGQYIDV